MVAAVGHERFLEQEGWHPQQVEDAPIYQMSFSGESGSITCYAPVRVEEKTARQTVVEFITRANCGLWIGDFEMDWGDGEARYKSSLDLRRGADAGDDRNTLSPYLFNNLGNVGQIGNLPHALPQNIEKIPLSGGADDGVFLTWAGGRDRWSVARGDPGLGRCRLQLRRLATGHSEQSVSSRATSIQLKSSLLVSLGFAKEFPRLQNARFWTTISGWFSRSKWSLVQA